MAKQWLPQFTRHDILNLREKVLFSGFGQIKQYHFQHRLFEGGESKDITCEIFSRPPAVAVLLYDPDTHKVVLIEQFRIGALEQSSNPWLLEIVAGVIDEGEKPEKTAVRETQEETGYSILSLLPVCEYLTSPGTCSEKMIIYCGLVKAGKSFEIHGKETGEDIKVHVMPMEEAFSLLSQGKILSSPAVIALQWLQINHSSLNFPLRNQ